MDGRLNGFCGCLLNTVLVIGVAVVLMSFTNGAKRNSVLLEPSFASLEEGEPSLMATIYDEATVTEIHDVSFFGHASIGGIRKDTDDSVNKLELSKIRELVIEKGSYESKRFRDREFTLAKVIMVNGTLEDNLLIPKHIVICGVDKKTLIERSWFLSKIDKMIVEKLAKEEAPEVVIEKIYKKEQEEVKTPIVRQEEKIRVRVDEPKKQVACVPEEKKPGFTAAVNRLWHACVDVVSELIVTVKGLF